MKQNIYIAALLAGMLALAGCGGGGSAVCDPESDEFQCLGEDEYNRQGQAKTEKDDLAMKATALETALTAAEAAGEAVTDVQITAITDAHTALAAALEDATEADETAAQDAYDTAILRLATVRANKNAGDANRNLAEEKNKRITAQKAELTSADNALTTALTAALDADAEDVTEAMVTAITDARTALEEALRRAVDVSDEDKEQYQRNVEDSSLKIATVQEKRKTAIAAKETRDKEIEAGNATDRANAASLKAALDNVDLTGSDRPAGFDEDNETSDNVPALHGWTGTRYEHKTGSKVTGEGYLYTKAGKATEGKPISDEFTGLSTDRDTLNLGDGTLSDMVGGKTVKLEWISIDGFTKPSGWNTYDNTHGATPTDPKTIAEIPGMFYGVEGTYICTPGNGNKCAVNYESGKQRLGIENSENEFAAGGAWMFHPDDRTQKVTDGEVPVLVEYGWWLDKSGSDGWTVMVFADNGPGQGDLALGSNDLPGSGTAKYVGGAAGKYAFSSLLGDSHEAGHFTARVTLNAKFDDNTISGTVNGFEGDADGMDAWSVALGTSRIGDWDEDGVGGVDDRTTADNGFIAGKYANPGSTTADPLDDLDSKTTWTIGSTAADAGGGWQGQLWNLENGVPTVATGTFTAEYGSDATMAGAFGADQE